MQNEPKLADPRPRERTRDTHSLALLLGGGTVGAIAFAIGVWIVGAVSDHDYSAVVYIVAAVIGSGMGAGIFPFVSLARQDGEDAAIVGARSRRGSADAPIEGAEAVDEGRAPRSAGGIR